MSYENIENQLRLLRDLEFQYWLNHSLFSPYWWILLAAAVIPWFLWARYFDRTRSLEIMIFGLIWAIVAMTLDEVGATWMLWSYPIKLLPIIPPLVPANLTIFPVVFMVIYQNTKTYRSYLVRTILVSGVFAFVVEVVFVQIGLFKIYRWEHWMSFIGFIVVSSFIWWFHRGLMKLLLNNSRRN